MRRIGIGIGARSPVATMMLFALIAAGPGRAWADTESWDAIYLGGSKVGHMHIQVQPLKEGNRQLQRVRVDFELSLKRGADTSKMELQYGTIETPEGQVLRLHTRTLVSQQVLEVHGDVIRDKMKLVIESGGQSQEQVLEWTPDTLGPYGAELSLSRKPIKPGEIRKVKTFIPILNKIGTTTLTARAMESVVLGGGVGRELLRIDQEITFEDGKKVPEMNSTLWVDEGGQILKSFTDADGGTMSYRTTKAAALKPPAQQFDLIAASIVKLARKITNPEGSRDVVYKATMTDSDPTEIFPNDRRQTIKASGQARTAILEVKTAGPFDGEAGSETVGPEFLRSNPLVTSDDPRVVALARRAVAANTDPWAKAQAINKWVATNLKNKNFETSFAPAAEVAGTLAGDCTEHAVLTAAMCRAQGVPARVATGLVYATHLGGFGFHMWNEVYVNRRWVAIDSAFDQTQVDGVHIKLSDSSLDGVSPFETFLPVSRVFGKLKLEAVEVR